MSKIKIALLCPILDDPTSWYRGLGPYNQLQREGHIELTFPQACSWASLINSDILVLQRPALPEHFSMLVLAKNMGLKVIVDFDDDNLSVPKDNPTYPQYSQMPIKESILNIARNCDVLQVSTKFLKEKYGTYNKNTVIIPNALDDRLTKTRFVHPGERENKILWRGTLSGQRNLMTVAQPIYEISKRHPEYRFVFFGVDPYQLTEVIPNSEVISVMPLTNFFQTMCSIHGKLSYYPLHFNDHSQARSHISWIESTYGNMVCLGYGNDEFKRPGCLNYTSLTEFTDIIEAVIRGEVNIQEKVDESWSAIMDSYLLSKVNIQRLVILRSLI